MVQNDTEVVFDSIEDAIQDIGNIAEQASTHSSCWAPQTERLTPLFLTSTHFYFELVADGKFVIAVDNEDRENEGDLIIAAEKVTTEQMAFLIRHSR